MSRRFLAVILLALAIAGQAAEPKEFRAARSVHLG
jgi:hypothetical protein